MNKAMKNLAISALFVLLAAGCGQKGAKLQKSVVPPDRTLFETGDEYLSKSQFIKARLAFQTLINTYPDSDLTADSYFAIGDSFYDEGGTQNLLQAEDQYKNFIIFFPTHPKAADAQLKIISANMKMMRSPDRDQNYTERAEAAIKRFEDLFPGSDYLPIVRQYKDEVQENLALRDFGVGEFYAQRGNYAGARSRFEDIPKNYPNFSRMDEAFYQLAQVLESSENKDEAAIYYGKIASGFPFSKRFEESRARLAELGKNIPAVDTQLAAANQAKVKPAEGFSPLKPFISFVEALGFKGPPDRYEAARRTVEAARADAVAAAAAAEGGAAGDDLLIRATLTKDASGKTQETAVLGANPNEKPAGSDKEGDKKKETKKEEEKKKKPDKP